MQYGIAADVSWSVERYGIRVRSSATSSTTFINEPDAAIWDLLSRGYSAEKTAELYRWIAGLEPSSAKEKVKQRINHWTNSGFLRSEN